MKNMAANSNVHEIHQTIMDKLKDILSSNIVILDKLSVESREKREAKEEKICADMK